jgi:kynurenine formamidase
MMPQDPVASLVEALGSGAVEVVDLTQPLNERTPVIQLPEQFEQTPAVKRHEISRYDERGPAWAWYWLEIGEHTGTHFDAPIHWISGREGNDVSQVPPRHLIAPAVVIDRSAESAENPDYLLTVDDLRAFEDEHGPLPEGGWLLLHTGWDARAQDTEAFLNAQDGIPHSPGLDVECARWIAEESPLVGVGVETVGIDAGGAAEFDPPFPAHFYLMGTGKYGVTQLANLGALPPTGALFFVAPLKLTGGTGSPVRAIALVPQG